MDDLLAVLDEVQAYVTGEADGLAKIERAEAVLNSLPMGEGWISFQAAIASIYGRLPGKTQGDYIEEALRRYQLVLEHRTPTNDPSDWARMQSNLGSAWRRRLFGNQSQNFEKAVECYVQALTVYTKKAERFAWGSVHNCLGNAYAVRIVGDPIDNVELAIKHLGLALRAFTKDFNALIHARCKGNLAGLYFRRETGRKSANLERAILHARAGLKALNSQPANHDTGNLHAILGACYRLRKKGYQKKNFIKTLAHNRRALQILDKKNFPGEWAGVKRNLAIAYRYSPIGVSVENNELARDHFLECLEIFTPEKFPNQWIEIQQPLCNTYAVLKDWMAVIAVADEVIETARERLVSLNDIYERRRLVGSISTVKNLKVLALSYTSGEASALAALQDHRAEMLQQSVSGPGAGNTSEPQKLANDQANIYFCIQPLYKEPTLAFVETLGAGQRKLELIRLPRLSNVDLGQIIETDTKHPELTWMGGYQLFEESGDPSHFMRAMDHACEALSERLEPLMSKLRDLPQSVTRLQITSSGGLSLFPFSILYLGNEHHERVIDRFAVEYSTGLPRRLDPSDGAASKPQLLAIVDPRENLKFASREADGIGLSFEEPRFLSGAQATKSAIVKAMSELDVGSHLHFICHGNYSWRHPEVSHLELAGDETLSLHDVANDVHLPEGVCVTLSACETGINEYKALPEETYGLPLAFLSAGASQVTSPLWPVSDYMTAELMGAYHRYLTKGLRTAEALRLAQLAIRDRSRDEIGQGDVQAIRWGRKWQQVADTPSNQADLKHPYFWGGFVSIG